MQTIIVTGASSGIGRAISDVLAAQGYHIIMACRNVEKGERTKDEIIANTGNRNIEVAYLDLLSLKSVQQFIDKFGERREGNGGIERSGEGYGGNGGESKLKIYALINNAGAMFAEPLPTEDRIERTLATNYTSVFALTTGLLSFMADGSTIINTLSVMVHTTKIDRNIFDIPSAKEYKRLNQYSRSKVALMYFTYELAKRVKDSSVGATVSLPPNISVCATDPGVVNTGIITMGNRLDPLANIFFRPFCKKPETAAEITLRALRHRQNSFLYKGHHSNLPLPQLDEEFSRWLWNETATFVEKTGRFCRQLQE
ncbi:MAG: SDR family NAD(P)-dependent oxidoreductase [Bacteroidales bacterium]|jgi:NAD(P)-dependent dehydrogenase (short-subunit alcohol dehydrogenase family)|nr:SDR family NAD(P)-dependent oxidoreductase [Bacteroidales bacterium]